MRDKLLSAVESPYFKPTLITCVKKLIEASQLLSIIGIDINTQVSNVLLSINAQLQDAAYSITDIHELIQEARSIGDEEIVKKPQKEGGSTPPSTT